MSVRFGAAILVPVLASTLASPHLARAADDRAAAKALAATAATLAKQERYQEAIELYEKAYGLDPDPVLLFNIAYLYEKQGKLFEAVRGYELTLDAETSAPQRRDTESRLEQLRPRAPGRLALDGTPPGARVLVDGRSVGVLPTSSLELPAGDHELRVTSDGFLPEGRTVKLVPGRESTLTFALTAAPASPPPVEGGPATPEEPVEKAAEADGDDTLTWVLVGVGAAVLVGGGIAAGVLLQPGDPAGPPTPDMTWTLPAAGGK